MTEQLNEVSDLVEDLQGTADEIDTLLLNNDFLSDKYTMGLAELRQRFEVLKLSIKSFSEQINNLKEEQDEF